MNEKLLQFIWQFGYFNKSTLTTTAGEPVTIITPGSINTDQGPDFTNAKISIGATILAGAVEVHFKSSHWKLHSHTGDSNYKKVILHVVYDDDEKDDKNIPVVELKERIAHSLLKKYEELMEAKYFIACEKSINAVPQITIQLWKESLAVLRLQHKTETINGLLALNQYHWEETFWWLLARNFGIKVNADAFEAVAKSISINLLAKHKNNLIQLEALLLGQAGLLEGPYTSHYPVLLQKEYSFLKKKYKLNPIHLPVYFLRMRPGNFPTIRLSQLAALIHASEHLFSKIIGANSLKEVKTMFDVKANDFWNEHYTFNETTTFKEKILGASMIDGIIINTVVPAVFAYGSFHKNELLKNKAQGWLEEIKAEKNHITKGFALLGVVNKNAFDSQALIELKTNFCDVKRCLNCAVGNAVLKRQA